MSHKAIPDAADEYCGTSYAAKLLNLSVGSIQSLVEKNELRAWKTQGGHRRISIQSIHQYQNRANLAPKAPAQAGGKYLKVCLSHRNRTVRGQMSRRLTLVGGATVFRVQRRSEACRKCGDIAIRKGHPARPDRIF